jgi:UDP-2,3-diacylglucosamine hydrolase
MVETLFVADIHLDERKPALIEAFQTFLTRRVKYSAGLYILGDLFEFWHGDDDNAPAFLEIQRSLKQLTSQGIPIYFMRGNRDFLIGKRFAQHTGCQLLEDEIVIELNEMRILLMHGDNLCTNDVAYQKWKKWRLKPQNQFIQKLYLILPLFVRRSISNRVRQKSRQETQKKALEIMDVSQQTVEEMMQKYQVTHLIHGHTHRPQHHKFELNQQVAHRFVVDAWYERGNALVFDGQTFKLEYF